jgi:hypothetical protein
MAVTAKGFDSFWYGLARGRYIFQTDTFKIALSNSAPAAGNDVLADITQISATTNGYTTGGTAVAGNSLGIDLTGAVTTIGYATDDVVFTQSGANPIGPFQYAVLYRSGTVDSVTDPLVAVLDLGSTVTLTAGATYTVNTGADGWVKITNPAWA